MIPRLQLFEIADARWFPASLREYVGDYLAHVEILAGFGELAIDPLYELLESTGHRRLVDLGSGAGGPFPAILERLAERLEGDLTGVLTDAYPNRDSWRSLVVGHPSLIAESEPVDARRVPDRLRGVRTLFNSFHHFDPPDARRILEDAAAKGAPIALFELARRTPGAVLSMLLVPLLALVVTPRIRPFRWGRILWTYLVPVVPLVLLWDGIVSQLRAYTQDELRRMAGSVSGHSWSLGEARNRALVVTWLIGRPTTEEP